MAVSLRRSSFEAYFLSFFINPLAKMAGAVRFSSSRETLDTKRTTQHTDRHRHRHTQHSKPRFGASLCVLKTRHTLLSGGENVSCCVVWRVRFSRSLGESHIHRHIQTACHTITTRGLGLTQAVATRAKWWRALPTEKKNKRRPTRVIYRSKLKTILFKWFFPFYFSNIC